MPETRTEPRPDKVAAVAELAAAFRDSTATVLTEYRGLTMSAITTLRRSLGNDTSYKVVKNTLTKRAATEAGVSLDEKLFTGPTAIAFVGGDPVEAAKGIRDFSKSNPLLVIKGAVLDGQFLSADEVRKLADLESREVLLSRLAGAMLASLSQAAALFQAPLSQMARLAQALADQKLSATTTTTTTRTDAAATEAVPTDDTPAPPAEAAAPAEDPQP